MFLKEHAHPLETAVLLGQFCALTHLALGFGVFVKGLWGVRLQSSVLVHSIQMYKLRSHKSYRSYRSYKHRSYKHRSHSAERGRDAEERCFVWAECSLNVECFLNVP
jgi:hypothetical protein